MARWQKHARLGLGLFAVAFAGALWFMMGDRPDPAPVQAIERLDPKATSEIRGGDVIQVKGATRDVRVEFASQVLYTDGRTRFTAFKAFVDNRGGRSFVVSGNEAWVGAERSTFDVTGNVSLSTSDGLTATTPRANFVEADGILRGGGPLQFQRGRVRGSGVGFTYDRALDRLSLLDKASIQVAPQSGAGAMQIDAGAAGYSRAERFMRFERGVRMERQSQVIEAESSTIFLRADRDEPETVELRGNSKITGATGTGSLRAMQAQDINLRYAPDGRTLEHALLVGQSSIQLAQPDASPGQQLAAQTIDLQLAPDGAVTRLTGRDQVRVTLPSTPDTPARTVDAPLLDASGEPGKGITSMAFENGAEFREAASKGGAERVARAPTLKALVAASGAIDEAVFAGGFRFENGKLIATSTDAVYKVVDGTLGLTSRPRSKVPHIADERVVIDAARIDVTLTPRQLTAAGNVSAELSVRRREGERGTTLLDEQEPVLVTAEKFTFDEQSGSGSYTGHAVLWQLESGTSIRGDSITMNQKAGMLTATGNVVSSLPIAGRKEDGAKGTSVGKAGEFQFDDAKRRVVFTKTAQLDGVQGNLHADRIELFLAPKDNALERLEAEGAVKATVEKREATGRRLTYHPADEKYVLTGSPVRLVEGCEESTGRTLTFYRGSDRISVDGNQEVRVQTRGSKCPEMRD